jgi:polysaccharide export outer membrane protein
MIFRVARVSIVPFLLSAAAILAAPRNSDTSSSVPESASTPDYILQPQDVIRVQVFQEDDINKQGESLSISQESTVSLPLIGTISLKGKSVRQSEEMIRALYDRDYIVNPQVSVTVVKYAERTVNVIGSVTNQGRIQFPQERGLTIVDAISLAGGQTRLADLRKVKLTRKNGNGDMVVEIIDVDAMMKTAGRDQVQLAPGDVIFVPERIL